MTHRWACLGLFCMTSAATAACVRPGDTVFTDAFDAVRGRTYYVATNGSDAAAGDVDSPWSSIQHAVDVLLPGETACVRGGTYAEVVSVTRGGSQAAGPVTVQAVPGDAVVIDGSGLSIPNGQWGLLTLADVSFVTIRGLALTGYASSSADEVPIGLYLTGAGSGVRLLDNHIHDIRNTAAGCAANAFGLKVDGTRAPASINALTIAGNEIDHLVLGCSESLSLDGNVEHWTITGNSIHDTNNIAIGAIGFERVSPDPAYDQARDGVISDNLVYNISSFGNPAYGDEYAADGIYVDGGKSITIERNRIHHVDIGIELASEHAGRTTSDVVARNNLVYFGQSAGISIGGYAPGVGGSERCSIIGNTLFHNDLAGTGSGELQIQYHASANLFENNVVVAGASGLILNAYAADTAAPAVLDHNLHFAGASPKWIWQANEYSGLEAYVGASGQDANSLFATPGFLDPVAPDLRLPAASPAIDAGIDLGQDLCGASDFSGAPRIAGAAIDIGAYER